MFTLLVIFIMKGINMNRQKVRKLLLLISLLLFPITIYYFSPYVIIQGALEGIINGSFIVFSGMLIGSIFFGRLFCGYLCPAGRLQDCVASINNKNPKQGWKNKIKYVIWAIWITAVFVSFIFHGEIIKLDFFYMTESGISVSNIYAYIVYYGIIILFFVPPILFGKRVCCHYICWMAPFMVIGTKIGKALHIKRLRLVADQTKCINCHLCDKSCPMSLSVSQRVQLENMNDSECILCGACVDNCPKKAIKYKF